MRVRIPDFLQRRPLLAWFGFVAAYALGAGLLVQLVAVPVFLGDRAPHPGLVPGLDSVAFHEEALRQLAAMREHGWAAWEWNPTWSDFQPAGLASAVYYFTGPSPLWLLPLNAGVHAAGALVLVGIVRTTGASRRAGILASLPFAFYPSTLTWVAQLHKDGVFCLGLFLFVLGAVRLWVPSGACWRARGVSLILMVVGAFLASSMRAYAVTLLLVASLLAAVPAVLLLARRQGRWVLRITADAVVFLGAMAIAFTFSGSKGTELPDYAEPSVAKARDNPEQRPFHWEPTDSIPAVLDERFRQIALNRYLFVLQFNRSGSMVDREWRPGSALEVIAYAPRALWIALVAPFPEQWTGTGTSPTGTVQRRIAGLEMVLVYLAFLGWLPRLRRGLRPVEVWIAATALLMMIPLAMAIPAVGTLYRIRFGPYSLLLSLGIAGWVRLLENRQLSGEGKPGFAPWLKRR